VRFLTAEEFEKEVPPATEWIVRPWVAAGAITEFDGKVKAAGKTTFVTHMCRSVLEGSPFMGEPTRRTPIVYLTEQPRASLREALARAGLLGRKDLVLLLWQDATRVPWPDIVAEAIEKCREIGAQLLVVDTIAQFARLLGERENNAGDALEAIAPLQMAAAAGIGVVVVRHESKKGGAVGDSGRGSSAFSGAVDIVVSIKRLEGSQSNPNERTIEALSRFDETPNRLSVELTDNGYVSHGITRRTAAERASEAIMLILPAMESEAQSLEEIVTATGQSRASVQKALEELVNTEKVLPTGSGHKGSPFRYHRRELLSASTPTPTSPAIQ